MSEREEHGGEETVCEKDLNKFGFVMFGELWDCLAYVNTVCVCVCVRSSSCYGDGKSCRGSEQAPCSPEPRQGKSSPCNLFCSAADDPFYQTEDEQQVRINSAFAYSMEYSMFH